MLGLEEPDIVRRRLFRLALRLFDSSRVSLLGDGSSLAVQKRMKRGEYSSANC